MDDDEEPKTKREKKKIKQESKGYTQYTFAVESQNIHEVQRHIYNYSERERERQTDHRRI